MKAYEIASVCIVGSGTMGSSIALSFAKIGIDVDLYDISDQALERGFLLIHAALDTLVENGLTGRAGVPAILARIRRATDLGASAADTAFVIECAPENLEIKHRVFRQLEAHFPKETVFASNTSSLSPTKIASALSEKGRFIAANFWNPAHLLPLVEIMPGEETSEETVQFTREIMERIGKEPVVLSRETPGYIGNRLQFALLREALYLVDSGIATKEDVDRAVRYGIGRRLGDTGPLETADLGGTHVFAAICESLFKELCNSTEVSPALLDAARRGDLGYSTGKGLYEWTPEKLEKIQKNRQETLIEWLRKDQERGK
ncbi:MAG: 3-hydroxyacyl-CoA dehydrogenase family protein [Thermovirgaceae bacterium]|nr:3-hydroxyacyl-CoA dehydrogenase family protein [Thermovirgaceae bacterium]